MFKFLVVSIIVSQFSIAIAATNLKPLHFVGESITNQENEAKEYLDLKNRGYYFTRSSIEQAIRRDRELTKIWEKRSRTKLKNCVASITFEQDGTSQISITTKSVSKSIRVASNLLKQALDFKDTGLELELADNLNTLYAVNISFVEHDRVIGNEKTILMRDLKAFNEQEDHNTSYTISLVLMENFKNKSTRTDLRIDDVRCQTNL